jgi:hypothetical protein
MLSNGFVIAAEYHTNLAVAVVIGMQDSPGCTLYLPGRRWCLNGEGSLDVPDRLKHLINGFRTNYLVRGFLSPTFSRVSALSNN